MAQANPETLHDRKESEMKKKEMKKLKEKKYAIFMKGIEGHTITKCTSVKLRKKSRIWVFKHGKLVVAQIPNESMAGFFDWA